MSYNKILKENTWGLCSFVSTPKKNSAVALGSNIHVLTARIKRLREKKYMKEQAKAINRLFVLGEDLSDIDKEEESNIYVHY